METKVKFRFSVKVFTSLLLLISTINLYGQNLNKARKYFDSLEAKIIEKDSLLLSYPALNIFMAKRINSYLSGSSDLSLFKSYFVIDPTDGRLFLGLNCAKDPSKTEKRTKWIATFGVKGNIKESFSTIYSGNNSKLSNDMGASFKISLLGRGIIFYGNKTEIQPKNKINGQGSSKIVFSPFHTVSYQRIQMKNELLKKMKSDSTDFVNNLKGIGDDNYINYKKGEYFDKRSKFYKREFITKEAELAEDEDLKVAYWNHWASFELYAPFTSSTYEVAQTFDTSILTKSIYAFEGTFQYNNVYEGTKFKLFANASFGVKYTNNVKTESINKYEINEYKNLGGIDTLKLGQIESNEVYIGNYENFISPFIRAQAVFLFIKKKSGLSFMYERYFGSFEPINMKVGVPISLSGISHFFLF